MSDKPLLKALREIAELRDDHEDAYEEYADGLNVALTKICEAVRETRSKMVLLKDIDHLPTEEELNEVMKEER